MSKILGIDLGTTNSAMAIIEGGQPKIVENAEGNRTTPSVAAISKTDEKLVGLLAKRQAVVNPENTVFGIKRLLGHRFDSPEVQRDVKEMPFKIEKSGEGAVVKMAGKDYRPEEISAMILGKLKKDAEDKVGEKIEEAVITVPAYFDDAQRKATKDAGEIAGFKVKRIINEPTAAALAYGFDKKADQQIVVFDFGGGTFDVSVLEVSEVDGEKTIEVKSTDGDSHMGGVDIDAKLIKWVGEEFKKENGIDILQDPLAVQRIKEEAEKAKLELSTTLEAEINIPFITHDETGPKNLLVKITRAKLEELAKDFIDRSIEITKRAVKASPFEIKDIDEVILVGGQTRMPAIQEAVKELFGKEPNRSINPDEVVSMGAAIQAGIFQGDVKDVLLLDVTPLSLGIETLGGVATKLIDRNTTVPASKTQVFSTAADNQPSVEVHVVQGEREMAADNKTLGRFVLDGIPPSPRGVPQVEVTFDLNADGILTVKAVEKTTGKEQSIRIENSSGLSKDEVERMKRDAEEHAEEDKKKKEVVQIRNTAEVLISTAEKGLKDAGDKISEDIKSSVEQKISALKEVKDKEDMDAIKKASEELSTEMQKIGEAMANAAKANGDATPEKTENKEGKVRDADFKEEDGEGDK